MTKHEDTATLSGVGSSDGLSVARERASALMQRGRSTMLRTAIEEAITSLETGMTHGAIMTLKNALSEDKDFHS